MIEPGNELMEIKQGFTKRRQSSSVSFICVYGKWSDNDAIRLGEINHNIMKSDVICIKVCDNYRMVLKPFRLL